MQTRIKELKKPELRKVLTYERKHANRKSVVGASRSRWRSRCCTPSDRGGGAGRALVHAHVTTTPC